MINLSDRLMAWQGGGIAELAEESAQVLDSLGFSDDTLGSQNDLERRIRVIRDYAQRRILSPPDRQGKEAVYGALHLKQLVAARLLVREGVPLSKIAEQFQQDEEIVIMTLGGEPPAPNPALSRVRSIRKETAGRAPSGRRWATSPSRGPDSAFLRTTALHSGRRLELKRAMDRLGASRDAPRTDPFMRVAIDDWLWLLIDRKRLRELSTGQIEDLSTILAAALLHARNLKED